MKKHVTILVVDDNDDIRQLFTTVLRESGYHVLEAATGQQGLHLAQTRIPDLVLLDVRLPDISGVEVCRKIKTNPRLQDVFVALCSGEAVSDDHKVTGLELGADEYLVKPMSIRELLARVQTLVRLHNTTTALRASEAYHRRLIDILPDAVFLIHPKGRLLTANSQAVAMLGYDSAAELLEKSIFELSPEEQHERIKSDISSALKVGILRDVQYTLLKKDRTLLRVELSATVSLGINEQPAGLLSMVRDINERTRAQEAVKASEEKFRQLADNIREVFWMSNADRSKFIYVSPAFEHIWGQPCSTLYTSPGKWIEFLHPDDRERVMESTLTKSPAREYDEIYRIIRPDGSIRWIEDRAFPIYDASGNLYRIVGIADDITKRKEALDSLAESEARKRAIMQAALDCIITIDHEGRIIELNSAAEKIFAFSRSKFIGENVIAVIPPSFKPWFLSGLAIGFSGGKGPTLGSRIEMPALRADGSRFSAEFAITPITLMEHPMFTLYIRDITQRKRAEAELRSLPQRILRAQEAERSRIAQELHDGINQLIASVKMRLRKVESSLPDLKPAAREILRRCDQVLVRVLEENRRIAHNLRPAELDNLGLSAACSSFCNEVQSRTNLRVECRITSPKRRLPSVIELHLFRIIQEAINNITKHARAKLIKLQIQVRSDLVLLKIQDDGQGFDPIAVEAGKKIRHGLGLTNMRERALAMNGDCEIKSQLKRGTTIIVRVPLAGSEKVENQGRKNGLPKRASRKSASLEQDV
jgi:PAS domain S-box-containing protein